MSNKSKVLLAILVIVLMVPMIATVFLNQGDTKKLIGSYIESKTGREFSIAGSLASKWGLSPIVYAEQVRLANSNWAQTPYAFTADKVTISLSFLELLRGQLKVTAIKLEKPQLWIEQHAESGKFNLDLRSSPSDSYGERLFPEWLDIDELSVRNGWIFYFHKNRNWEFKIFNGIVESPGFEKPTRIELLGEAENTAISLSGKLGSMEALLNFNESPVELGGYIGVLSNRLSITGVIQDLLHWHGLNLWMESEVANLADLSELFGFWLPPYKNITAKWELVQPESTRTLRLESLRLDSQGHGLQAYAEGEIGQLTEFNEVDIKFNAIGNLDKDLITERLSSAAILQTSVSGSVSGDRENLAINIDKGEILTSGIKVNFNGAISNGLNDWTNPLPVRIKVESLEYMNDLFTMADDQAIPGTGEINIEAGLIRRNSKFELTGFNVTGNSSLLDITGVGNLRNLGSDQEGELTFQTVLQRSLLDKISKNRYLALLDQLSMTGVISVKGAEAWIDDLNVDGFGDGVKLQGAGSLRDLAGSQDIEMGFEILVDSLSKLESLPGHKLPDTTAIKFLGRLGSDDAGDLGFRDINGELADPSISLDISGEILKITDKPQPNLNISWRLGTLRPLKIMYPDFSFPEFLEKLVPISGGGQLRGKTIDGSPAYSFENIEARTNTEELVGEITGHLENLFAGDAVPPGKMKGKLSLNLSGFLDQSPISSNDGYFFDPAVFSGNLDSSMDFNFSDSGIGVENIKLNLDSEESSVRVDGAITRISPFQPGKLDLEINAKSLHRVIGKIDLPLDLNNPVKAKATFSTRNNSSQVDIAVDISGNDLEGLIILPDRNENESENGLTRINANLRSEKMDLTEILVGGKESTTFFSREPLKLDWLLSTRGDLGYTAKNFKNRTFILNNFESKASIENGILNASATGHSSRGVIKSDLVLKKQGRLFDTNLSVHGDNIDFSSLTKLERSPEDNAGVFSVNVDLAGSGMSTSEIAGNSKGDVVIELSGAKIKNDGLQLLGGDLFLGLFDAINPLTSRDDYLDIECGVIQFDIEDGIANTEHGLALKTSTVTLLGGGSITLFDENLRLIVSSKARKGFGINTNTIAKMIRVGGTIKNPEIEPDPKGFLQTSVAIGAAIYSGGLSLLAQGLFDKSAANADVCSVAANSVAKNINGDSATPAVQEKR